MLERAASEALGRTHREEPSVGRHGGPAGNARLTAALGVTLLVLFAVQGVTILDLHGLLTWHLIIGAVLVPVALAKTAVTGWRMVSYYRGNAAYREAGAPPMLLRVLAPGVVLTTLAVLGTGVAVVFMGSSSSRQGVLGTGISMLFLHKATFILWCGFTGLHLLGRLIPAWKILTGPAAHRVVAGRGGRVGLLLGVVATAALAGVLIVSVAPTWHGGFDHHIARTH